MDVTKKVGVGPGGMKCECCGPAPGRDKKRHRRQVKRSKKVKEALRREVEEGLDD